MFSCAISLCGNCLIVQWLSAEPIVYKVGPPSYKMVYKPHEYYSYRYHKP